MASPASHSSFGTPREVTSRLSPDVRSGVDDGHILKRSIQISHARIELAMTTGGGTPLVLLHGRFGCITEFHSLMASSLGVKRTMVAIDLPGHGNSSAAYDPEQSYTLEGYADSVIEVLDHLGIERVGVLGRELGGHIGLEMAGSFPGFAGLLLERAWTETGLDRPKGHTDRLRSARSSLQQTVSKSGHPSPTKASPAPDLRTVPPIDDRYRRIPRIEISPTTAELAAVRNAIGRGRPFVESAKPHIAGTDSLDLASRSAGPGTWHDEEPRRDERPGEMFSGSLLKFLQQVDRVSQDLPCLGLCLSG